jgi:hypothetical protein
MIKHNPELVFEGTMVECLINLNSMIVMGCIPRNTLVQIMPNDSEESTIGNAMYCLVFLKWMCLREVPEEEMEETSIKVDQYVRRVTNEGVAEEVNRHRYGTCCMN